MSGHTAVPGVPAASRPPLIGVCARAAPVTFRGADVRVSFALHSHVAMIAAGGGASVLLPLVTGSLAALERVDGLLLPGGPDVSPDLYGARPHPDTRGVDPAVDRAEAELLDLALALRLPVLAICRGMQLLNVSRGGTLHQHLPEVVGHDRHRPPGAGLSLGGHRLTLAPDSRVAGILADACDVACHHHQAVAEIGTGLVATAWACDGTVEAIEVAEHLFAVGVQWEAGATKDDRLHRELVRAAAFRAGRSAAPLG